MVEIRIAKREFFEAMKQQNDIDMMKAEIERLRAALDPFARHAHCVDQIQPSSLALWCAQALNAVSEQQARTEK